MADRVTFTSGSADRIAKVVRTVEAGNRNTGALPTSPRLGGGGGAALKLCTFTGSWAINTSKTLTISGQSSPNTVSASNSLISLPDAGQRACVIAKHGGSWYLVNWQWSTAVAATAASLGATSLDFQCVTVGSLSTTPSSTFSVGVSSCATSQATARSLSYFG